MAKPQEWINFFSNIVPSGDAQRIGHEFARLNGSKTKKLVESFLTLNDQEIIQELYTKTHTDFGVLGDITFPMFLGVSMSRYFSEQGPKITDGIHFLQHDFGLIQQEEESKNQDDDVLYHVAPEDLAKIKQQTFEDIMTKVAAKFNAGNTDICKKDFFGEKIFSKLEIQDLAVKYTLAGGEAEDIKECIWESIFGSLQDNATTEKATVEIISDVEVIADVKSLQEEDLA